MRSVSVALLGKSRLVNGARVGRELSATTASSRLIILSCASERPAGAQQGEKSSER